MKTITPAVLVLLAAGAAAAAPGGGAEEPPLPRCASRADVERLSGRRVRLEGRYEVEPFPGGKRLQATSIVLPDRTRVIRSYRPVRAELALAERRVVVIGVVTRDAGAGPNVQQVLAPHVRPERIELAPGERAREPAPTEVPEPPLVRRGSELGALDDRWARLEGTLGTVTPLEDQGFWATATLRLADGTALTVEEVPTSRWAALAGQPVTVVARVRLDGGGRPALVGRSAVCAGRPPRCP